MKNFIDELIMLLSTDWFKPYWATLDVDVDESEKQLVQKGCREIVSQIVGDASEYWLISFSNDRREKTRTMFELLVKGSGGAEALLNSAVEWAEMSDEDLNAGYLFESVTEEVLTDEANEQSLALDSDIRSIVLAARQNRLPFEIDFRKLCENSKSSWDRYTKRLTPTLPEFLPDSISTFLRAREFKFLWLSIEDKLTPEQRNQLSTWYRSVAKSRIHRDIAPSYIGDP